MFMNSGVRKRFWAMLSILLLIFSMIISNAYKFLPTENTPKKNYTNMDNYRDRSTEINISDVIVPQKNNNNDRGLDVIDVPNINSIPTTSIESSIEKERTLKELRKSLQLPDLFQEIEPENANDDIAKDFAIKEDTPKVTHNTNNDIFAVAKSYKANEEYLKAIEEYKHIAEKTTTSIRDKAKCYEEIAHIFGIDKRYGTALSYAQKAYNLYPTTYGELLLARLYYKTGNIERANNRINNILKRDFWADR